MCIDLLTLPSFIPLHQQHDYNDQQILPRHREIEKPTGGSGVQVVFPQLVSLPPHAHTHRFAEHQQLQGEVITNGALNTTNTRVLR